MRNKLTLFVKRGSLKMFTHLTYLGVTREYSNSHHLERRASPRYRKFAKLEAVA